MFLGGTSSLKIKYFFPIQTMAQQGHDAHLCCVPALHQKMDIRTNLFTERVVKHWDRLSRQMVESPSLKCSKSEQDVALFDTV